MTFNKGSRRFLIQFHNSFFMLFYPLRERGVILGVKETGVYLEGFSSAITDLWPEIMHRVSSNVELNIEKETKRMFMRNLLSQIPGVYVHENNDVSQSLQIYAISDEILTNIQKCINNY